MMPLYEIWRGNAQWDYRPNYEDPVNINMPPITWPTSNTFCGSAIRVGLPKQVGAHIIAPMYRSAFATLIIVARVGTIPSRWRFSLEVDDSSGDTT